MHRTDRRELLGRDWGAQESGGRRAGGLKYLLPWKLQLLPQHLKAGSEGRAGPGEGGASPGALPRPFFILAANFKPLLPSPRNAISAEPSRRALRLIESGEVERVLLLGLPWVALGKPREPWGCSES